MNTNLKKMAVVIIGLLFGPTFLSAQVTEETTENASQELNQGVIAATQASNIFEIDAAKLALEKSKSNEVKNYAQQVLDNRDKHSQQYNELIAQKQWQIPATNFQSYTAVLQKLGQLEGTEFDNEYLQASLKNHTDWIAQARDYDANADADTDLKNLLNSQIQSYEKNIEWINNYDGESATEENEPID